MFCSVHKIITLLIVSILIPACGGGVSDVTNSHPSQFAPKAAPEISIKRNEKNQLIVDWLEQQDSQDYVIYVSKSENFESDQTSIINITEPPFIVNSLEAGITYFIKIRPSWETKEGPESNATNFVTPPTPPTDITIVDNASFTWQNENNTFNVYWSTNPDFSISNADGSTKGITDKQYQPQLSNHKNDEIVYFIVTTTNDNVESEISNTIEITTSNLLNTEILPPEKPKVTVSDGTFNMEWNDILNAESYSVYMAKDMGVTQQNAATLTSGMTHTGTQQPFGHSLTNGERFYLVVTATNDIGEESVESTQLSIKPKIDLDGVPNQISIEADKDHLTIAWTEVENALSYNVYWSNTPDVTALTEQLVPGGSDTTNISVTHTGLQNGLMHYYVVTAITSTGESEESSEVGATPYGVLPKPTNVISQEANKQITITWPEVPGAINYHLYMAFDNSLTKDNVETLEGWMKHTTNVTSPFVHPGLINDSTYYMRLTAVDQFGIESFESDLFAATPHASPGNQPPEVSTAVTDQTATEDELFNFQFSESTFADPEDDPLTYSATQHTLANLPDWLSFDPDTRTFNGTPLNADVGSIDIDLTATDDNENLITEIFTLDIINTNDDPTSKPIPPRTVIVGSNFSYQIDENTFNDIDVGDVLSITTGNLPTWLSFDSATLTFSGVPTLTDIGSLSIDVTADDGNGGTVFEIFQLAVIDILTEPLAKDDGPVAVNEDGSVTILILDNDIPAVGVLNPATVTIIQAPSPLGSLKINADGTITYTHNGDESSTDSFTYTVTDESGKPSNEALVSISIAPVNDPPKITGEPNTAVQIGTFGAPYSFTPDAFDPDNSPSELTFSIVNKPNWAIFEETTGALSGTPPGSDFPSTTSNVEISVSDGEFTDSLPPFNIQVVGTAPEAISDSEEIIAAGNSVPINVLLNDIVTDAAIDPSSIIIVSNGSKGTATPNADGTITYQSTVKTNASDSFTYTVKDIFGLTSNPAKVDITVTPWTSMDIGNVQIPGDFSRNLNTYTVTGSGANIGGIADEFHYVYKPIAGDIDISARVIDVQNPFQYSKAGIMIRDSLNPGAKFANLFVTFPTNPPQLNGTQVHLNTRTENNQKSFNPTFKFNSLADTPRYIRLTRRNNTFEAYESLDGNVWQIIGSIEISMGQNVYAGLAVNSRVDTELLTVNYDNLTLLNQTIAPPDIISSATSPSDNQHVDTTSNYYHLTGLNPGSTYGVEVLANNSEDINLMVFKDEFNNLECNSFKTENGHDSCLATANTSGELFVRVDGSYTSAGAEFSLSFNEWKGMEIGTNSVGTHSENSNKYTIAESGGDIFSTSDSFYFYYQKIQGDAEIIAKVSSQIQTNNWAKSGVMIREITNSDSKFVDVVVTPSPLDTEGVRFQSRAVTSEKVIHNNTRTNEIASPRWVKLTRRGNTFDAFESSDGNTWLFIGSTNVAMNSNAFIGLAVSASNIGATSTAVFEHIKVTNANATTRDIEMIVGPINTAVSRSVDTSDKFIKVTGLAPGNTYKVDILNLSADADLYVYTDNFESLQCPDITSYASAFKPEYISGTNPESCETVQATDFGELFIRVNGSHSSNGANFDLTVIQQ